MKYRIWEKGNLGYQGSNPIRNIEILSGIDSLSHVQD